MGSKQKRRNDSLANENERIRDALAAADLLAAMTERVGCGDHDEPRKKCALCDIAVALERYRETRGKP